MIVLKNSFVKHTLTFVLLFALFSCSSIRVSKKLKQFPSPFQFTISDSVGGIDTFIYAKARVWILKSLVNPKPVIEENKKAGIIVGKCVMEVPVGKDDYGNVVSNEHVHYIFSVEIKNGKYKCMLSGFWHEGMLSARGNNDMGSLNSRKPRKGAPKISRTKYYEVKQLAQEQANSYLKDFRMTMGTRDQ